MESCGKQTGKLHCKAALHQLFLCVKALLETREAFLQRLPSACQSCSHDINFLVQEGDVSHFVIGKRVQWVGFLCSPVHGALTLFSAVAPGRSWVLPLVGAVDMPVHVHGVLSTQLPAYASKAPMHSSTRAPRISPPPPPPPGAHEAWK